MMNINSENEMRTLVNDIFTGMIPDVCDELNIPIPQLFIIDDPTVKAYASMWMDKRLTVNIYHVRRLSKTVDQAMDTIIFLIYHELRHAWQYNHSKNIHDKSRTRFTGSYIPNFILHGERDADDYALSKAPKNKQFKKLSYRREFTKMATTMIASYTISTLIINTLEKVLK